MVDFKINIAITFKKPNAFTKPKKYEKIYIFVHDVGTSLWAVVRSGNSKR